MGEIVNLRRARKAKARTVAAETAAARRARFGRSAATVAAETAEQERVARSLDGARLSPVAGTDEDPGRVSDQTMTTST